jgi:hypothetical protein
MIYDTADAWLKAPKKRVLLFGMSGLGKTWVSNLLRAEGSWFHYSVDYRIGTRYMGEHIADNFKREAMKNPFLRELMLSDSVYIASNISFDNLAPVSTYLGKPGDPAKGGLPIEEYRLRQMQFRTAEIAALFDTMPFIDRAESLYGYPNFICDSGGSICEWVNPDNAKDPLLTALSANCLMVWIKGSDAHRAELIRRFDRAPKPMAYQPEFLDQMWSTYLTTKKIDPNKVDPDDFIRWTYAQALDHRQPLYASMAANWGVTVTAEEVAALKTAQDFSDLVARAIART